jgi:hypothetical protein
MNNNNPEGYFFFTTAFGRVLMHAISVPARFVTPGSRPPAQIASAAGRQPG